MGEFDLIAKYFARPSTLLREGMALGIGDDCALLQPRAGMQLAVSSDMLVEGRHFFADVNPERLGHKALAVNLSDLAACGAKPLAFTLALALPNTDEAWLEDFTRGLFALADSHECTLVGGDTTRGPLNICITVMGEVSTGGALLRSGACAGDDLYVSGFVGEARWALEVLQGKHHEPADEMRQKFARARAHLEAPNPRVALGLALRGMATSAIDISDGLLGDLQHMLQASGVGAQVQTAWINACGLPQEKALEFALGGGDDYELLFTAPPSQRSAITALAQALNLPLTRIGEITAQRVLQVLKPDGSPLETAFASFDHFKS